MARGKFTVSGSGFAGLLISGIAVVISIQGCGTEAGNNSTDSQQSQTQSASTPPAVTSSTKQVHITKADFGDNWPLTVGEATIINDDDSIYLEINGVSYATNGQARGLAQKNGTPDIDASGYLNQDKLAGLMYVIQRGLALNGH